MKHSVAGIVCVDSFVFVARRVPSGVMGGRWEFPGGKVDGNESYQEALAREFMEEFSLPIRVGELICETTFAGKNDTVMLHAYAVRFDTDDFTWVLTEHTDVKWVLFSEIEELYFVDSDLLLLPDIKRWMMNHESKT